MPIMVPRSSLTLVEQKVERLRTRLEVDFVQLLERGERVIDDILRRQVPESLSRQITDARQTVTETWGGIVSEIDILDPTLHRTALIGASRSIRQIDFIEKKIVQAARKKSGILRSQVESLTSSLAPRGGLQERSLCALPFLARHGRRLLSLAAGAIDPFAPEHRALVIE